MIVCAASVACPCSTSYPPYLLSLAWLLILAPPCQPLLHQPHNPIALPIAMYVHIPNDPVALTEALLSSYLQWASTSCSKLQGPCLPTQI
jgi:hypothetical protein